MNCLPPDQKITENLPDLVAKQGIVCKQPNDDNLLLESTKGIISFI